MKNKILKWTFPTYILKFLVSKEAFSAFNINGIKLNAKESANAKSRFSEEHQFPHIPHILNIKASHLRD
jgi:hypothetical protein